MYCTYVDLSLIFHLQTRSCKAEQDLISHCPMFAPHAVLRSYIECCTVIFKKTKTSLCPPTHPSNCIVHFVFYSCCFYSHVSVVRLLLFVLVFDGCSFYKVCGWSRGMWPSGMTAFYTIYIYTSSSSSLLSICAFSITV